MSLSLESLESLYLTTLSKADISNPDHLSILKDLQDRIQKARAGTRKIENAGAPIVYGNASTGKVEGVITKGPAHNTISEKISFPNASPVPSPRRRYNRWKNGPKYTPAQVQKAVNTCGGYLIDAGRLLGCPDPTYIYELVRKYGIKKQTGQQKLPLK